MEKLSEICKTYLRDLPKKKKRENKTKKSKNNETNTWNQKLNKLKTIVKP